MQLATKTRCDQRPSCSCRSSVSDWYRQYAASIRQFSLTRLGDPEAAQDCTSETFLRAFRQQRSFRCNGNGVRPWLFTIARNIAHDYHKAAWRRREVSTETVVDGHDPGSIPEQFAVRQAALVELARSLDKLPPEQAECLRLRFFADLSVRQVAEVMDRRENAVRALQYRATRKLTTILAQNRWAGFDSWQSQYL